MFNNLFNLVAKGQVQAAVFKAMVHANSPSANDKSPTVVSSAIVHFANLAVLCDLGTLASLPSMQELSQCTNALGDAGSLFNVLPSSDYCQWLESVAAYGKQLKTLGIDVHKASNKMCLVTMSGSGHALCLIVQAIDVAKLEVEVWIIDSTYCTFGADQWKLFGEHLEQWKASLEELQPAISNAKLIAQQQAVQMAGTSHVTIKE
ncbi:hypothetical protein H4S07_003717 [Coemansia furcata]|uniref:Uncharacterized protein n=1 Tax=Coemansia furcata TaxID=417177 RepID=A0ACC1LG21_9FUNG|nr:hypothetical protein H4S07_003717 [Coemansia furcata]